MFVEFIQERHPQGIPADVRLSALEREFDRWVEKAVKEVLMEEVRKGNLKTEMKTLPNGKRKRVFWDAAVDCDLAVTGEAPPPESGDSPGQAPA
jgi:hypothetical protein